ncbi:MAG: LysR family transcriptional regulator [Eggerthellaceae bacterium]|jgi:LysR family transcriptional activator of glutamate synthase operon
MELYQLRYFAAVARCENITEASRDLHVSQPSLSRAIRKLEEELDVELFDRIGRRIVLNDNGRVFSDSVTKVLDSVDSVEQDLNRYVHDRKRTLNIFSPVPMGDEAEILCGFMKKYPHVRVRCAAESTPYLANEVFDVEFFASFVSHDESNYLRLGAEKLVLSVPKGHPLASCESVRLRDLKDERFIMILPSKIRSVIDSMFAEAEFDPHIAAETQYCQYMNSYVAEGMGIAVVPGVTWFSKQDRKRVVPIPISDIERHRTLYLKWPERTPMMQASQDFCDYLVGYFEKFARRYPDLFTTEQILAD